MAILGFLTIPWLGPKDIIRRFLCFICFQTGPVLVLTLFKIYCIFGSVRGTGLRWYSRFFKSASLDSYVWI